MDLYTYYRSTSSYRVRIALELKRLDYRSIPVNLVREGGEHLQPAYRAINPQRRVPSLRLDSGMVLTQSPAIIEYLEEHYPDPPLLPLPHRERAQHRMVAAIISCDIHPLHNVAVLNRLRRLGHSEIQVSSWIGDWMREGLSAIEALIGDDAFCFDDVGLADVYVVPQLYAARRFQVPLHDFPRLLRVEQLALNHPAFKTAHPGCQVDTPGANRSIR